MSTETPTDPPTPVEETAEQEKAPTLQQPDVDRIVQERLARQREQLTKKYGDLDQLKTRADKHDELVAASQSEHEKALTQAVKDAEDKVRTQFQTDLDRRGLEQTRLMVAMRKGLPEDVASRVLDAAKRLQGGNEEELETDAGEFFKNIPLLPGKPAAPDLNQGTRNKPGDSKPSLSSGRDLYAQMHPKKTAS